MKEGVPSKETTEGKVQVVQRTHMEELNETGFKEPGLELIVLGRHPFLGRKRKQSGNWRCSLRSGSQ